MVRCTAGSSLFPALPMFALLLASQPVAAQSDHGGPAAASPLDGIVVQVGLEPHLVMSLGFMRAIGQRRERSALGAGVRVKLSPYLLGRGAGRLNLVAAGSRVGSGGWGGVAVTEAYLARGQNRGGTIYGLGLEFRSAPGYYGQRWALAADLGWQATLLSHIRHSAESRETFNDRHADGVDEPADGWYGSTAHRARIGLVTRHRLSDGAQLRLAAGSRFVLQRQGIKLGFAHGQVPVYVEASLGLAR